MLFFNCDRCHSLTLTLCNLSAFTRVSELQTEPASDYNTFVLRRIAKCTDLVIVLLTDLLN